MIMSVLILNASETPIPSLPILEKNGFNNYLSRREERAGFVAFPWVTGWFLGVKGISNARGKSGRYKKADRKNRLGL
jgi:hypothetical protein